MPLNLGADNLDALRDRVATEIDQMAGDTRLFFVSPGALVDVEYTQAEQAVKAWRAAGSPADDVPPEVASGAIYEGVDNEQSAQSIEQTATAYKAVVQAIRHARLSAKARALQADTAAQIAQARIAAVQAYAQIKTQYAALAQPEA